MSKRVTTLTEIKDRAIAEKALRDAGVAFRSDAHMIHINSGDLSGVSINLSTGDVTGDEDYHSKSKMGKLRQLYSEAKLRIEIVKQGGSVQSMKALANGDVELLYQIG
jgi:TRAP-type uncharacterized transport system substrate-binding protein